MEQAALPEANTPGYDVKQVMAELSDAARSFFLRAAEAAVVLKINRTEAAVIWGDEPHIEEKLRTLLTVRRERPFPLGLPVGFIAWTRAWLAVPEPISVPGKRVIVMSEDRTWFAMIPMKEYAGEQGAAVYIMQVFRAAGASLFLAPRPEQREIALVLHKPFQGTAQRGQ